MAAPAPPPRAARRPPRSRNSIAPQQLTGAQAVIRSLEELDVDVIFGIPGGAVLPVYDPLFDSQKLRHVLVRHEQGAGHAASGYAHATGKVGVCMATSGPGATNLVTPLADAQMDSIPVVAITGQVGRAADRHRRLPGSRHLRHHDADHQAQLPGPQRRRHRRSVMAEAFHIAASGRPGAVLVDIPKDVLQGQCTFSWPPEIDLPGYKPNTKPHSQAGPRGRQADRGGPQAGAVRRRRRDPRRGHRRAAGARRADRHPRRHHADGARRVPGQPSAAPRACRACTARSPRWPRCSAAIC